MYHVHNSSNSSKSLDGRSLDGRALDGRSFDGRGLDPVEQRAGGVDARELEAVLVWRRSPHHRGSCITTYTAAMYALPPKLCLPGLVSLVSGPPSRSLDGRVLD